MLRSPDLPDDVDLWDLPAFASGGDRQMLRSLADAGPVVWHDRPGGEPFWAVTHLREARVVLGDPTTFSSATARGGMFLRPDGHAFESGIEVGSPIIETDPPRHQPQRRVLARRFTPMRVADLETRVRDIARRCVDEAREQGRFDFVEQVAHVVPAEVTLGLLGVPHQDWKMLADLEHRMLGEDDGTAMIEMATYLFGLLTEKESDPGDDLLSQLLAEPVEGVTRGVVDLIGEAVLLINGGLDTTRAAASLGGLLPLLQQPEQLAMLRADPGLFPTAVEEFVRWASPIRHVARTATTDVSLGGVEIREGERVALWLSQANRDPDWFPDPDTYDITRTSNPHLGFSFGEHFCLGTHVARLILRVEFEEILRAWPTIELDGEPVGVASNFVGGLRHLPIRVIG